MLHQECFKPAVSNVRPSIHFHGHFPPCCKELRYDFCCGAFFVFFLHGPVVDPCPHLVQITFYTTDQLVQGHYQFQP